MNKSEGILNNFASPRWTEIGPKLFVIAGGFRSEKYIQNCSETIYKIRNSNQLVEDLY